MIPKFEGAPIAYAKSLKASELRRVISACKRGEYNEYADRCRICFEKYLAGDEAQALWWSKHAELVKPL